MTFEEIDNNKLEPRRIYNLKKDTELNLSTNELFHIKLGNSYPQIRRGGERREERGERRHETGERRQERGERICCFDYCCIYISSTQCTMETLEYQEPTFISATFNCKFSGENIKIHWRAVLTTNMISGDTSLNLGSSYPLFTLFCFVLFCFVLFCFVLFCFVLFCFVLFCFVLICFVLFCSVLFILFCSLFPLSSLPII